MADPVARDVLLAVAAVVFLVSFGSLALGADLRVLPLWTVLGAAVPPLLALVRIRSARWFDRRLAAWVPEGNTFWTLLAVVLVVNLIAQAILRVLPRSVLPVLIWFGIGAGAGTLGVAVGTVAWRQAERETALR